MFGAVMRFVGLVRVSVARNQIILSGLPGDLLAKDITKMWSSGRVTNNLFTKITRSHVSFNRFFLIEVAYIVEQLYETNQRTYTSKRLLKAALDELVNKTWLKDLSKQKDYRPRLDLRNLDKFIKSPLPHQMKFLEIYNEKVSQFHLNGYMLAAGAGLGKTLTQLFLAETLGSDIVIIICPNNALERVWETELATQFKQTPLYWTSVNSGPAPHDAGIKYFVFHYEALDRALDLVRRLKGAYKKLYVGLDESQNFNSRDSLRTNQFIELCRSAEAQDVVWASGTPIKAMGFETIPFLITVVRDDFDEDAQARFRKIFGRDAKRANDILRHRIGLLHYRVDQVPSNERKVNISQINVQMPTAKNYTLANLRALMNSYISERTQYYKSHFAQYESIYNQGLDHYRKLITTDDQKREFERYTRAIKMISQGYDPKTMKEEAVFCNRFELKVILPKLPDNLRKPFKGSRSVIKYVDLKIVGEALGNVLGRMRVKCHLEMVDHIPFEELIDNAKKKTLIFSSYVEVVKKISNRLAQNGYRPIEVHGETNKNLSALIKQFFEDPDANPCIATYQSLSTAVPMIAANREIMTNAPWRHGEREQAIARIDRLGQDEDVDIIDTFLDTGNEPNLSTRSKDILEWSKEQVAAIMGIQNLDDANISMESLMSFGEEEAMSDQSITAIHALYRQFLNE